MGGDIADGNTTNVDTPNDEIPNDDTPNDDTPNDDIPNDDIPNDDTPNDARIDDDTTDDTTDGDISNTKSPETKFPTELCHTSANIERCFQIKRAKWEGQSQPTGDLTLNIYMRTATNTALVRLDTYIYPKNQKNAKKQALYLFIYPENIETFKVRLKRSQRKKLEGPKLYYSVQISVREKPCLVYKKAILQSKQNTKACLDIMTSLAGVTEFTLEICNSSSGIKQIGDLQTLQSNIHNAEKHLLTDRGHADLSTLYAGTGGMIVDDAKAVAHNGTKPPPYTDSIPSEHTSSHLILYEHSPKYTNSITR